MSDDSLTSNLVLSPDSEPLIPPAVRATIDSSNMPIWYADGTGVPRYWNRAWRELTGESHVIDFASSIIHSRDLLDLKESLRQFAKSHLPFQSQFQVRRADGVYRTLSCTAVPQFSVDGSVTGLIAVCTDLSDSCSSQETCDSVNFLRRAVQIARIGGWELDLQTMQPAWSEEVYAIHEVERGQSPTLTEAINFYHPNSRPVIASAVEQAIKDGTPYDLELQFITARGRHLWVRAMGEADRVDGKTTRLFGTFQDITERKLAELSLRDRETQSNLIFEHLNEFIFIVTPDGELKYLSPNSGREMGYTPEELVGEMFAPLVHPDDIQGCFEHMLQLLEQGTSREVECRILQKDGTYRWFASTGTKLPPDADGNILLLGCTRDITDRKQMQESLRSSEEIFSIVTNAIDDIIGVSTTDRRISYVSPSFYRITGYRPEVIATSDFSTRVHPEDLPRVEDARRRNLNGEQTSIEWRCRHRDGHYLWLETRANPVVDARGTVTRIVACSRDVTERKRIEAEVRQYAREIEESRNRVARQAEELRHANELVHQASRSKSEFLANMSHEIRTPMTAILGYTDLLLTELNWKTTDRCEALHAIRRNGEHLLTIINDILDLSKIEAGRITLETISCDLRLLVQEVVASFQIRAVEKSLQMSVEFDTRVPQYVGTDPTRLRQILINLIGNAIKFTETGAVYIRVYAEEPETPQRKLRFEVIDTGIGIDAGRLEDLFLPFTQLDACTTRKFGGTGLGLTISRRLAEILGGGLSATSERGLGSTFVATIRYDSTTVSNDGDGKLAPELSHSALVAPKPPLLSRLDGCRILLAEDGVDNQRLIAFLLQRAGASIVIADNGKRALELLQSFAEQGPRIDLILMDMQMPELDGYSATRYLRQQGDTRPIIALTANAMIEDRQICLDAGCSDYISKPIDRAILLDVLSRWYKAGCWKDPANSTMVHQSILNQPR